MSDAEQKGLAARPALTSLGKDVKALDKRGRRFAMVGIGGVGFAVVLTILAGMVWSTPAKPLIAQHFTTVDVPAKLAAPLRKPGSRNDANHDRGSAAVIRLFRIFKKILQPLAIIVCLGAFFWGTATGDMRVGLIIVSSLIGGLPMFMGILFPDIHDSGQHHQSKAQTPPSISALAKARKWVEIDAALGHRTDPASRYVLAQVAYLHGSPATLRDRLKGLTNAAAPDSAAPRRMAIMEMSAFGHLVSPDARAWAAHAARQHARGHHEAELTMVGGMAAAFCFLPVFVAGEVFERRGKRLQGMFDQLAGAPTLDPDKQNAVGGA